MSKSNELFINRVSLAPFLAIVGVDNAKQIIMAVADGVLKALREHKISVTESENLLFNPDVLRQCEQLSMDNQVIELLEYGMELADIEELVTDETALGKAIADCLNLLYQLQLPALSHQISLSTQS